MIENAKKLEDLGGWNINFAQVLSPPICVGQQFLERKSRGKDHWTKLTVLDDVIPKEWCQEFISKHEVIGFTTIWELDRKQYKFVYEGAEISNTSEVITFENQHFADCLWNRVSEHIESSVSVTLGSWKGTTWSKVALIPTFRFMRYKAGQSFQHHYDPERSAQTWKGVPGIYHSLITLALYLNDQSEFEGGGLNFLDVNAVPTLHFDSIATVKPVVGRLAIFRHDELHEGGQLIEGTKYMLQCDVLFKLDDQEK